VPIDPDFPVDRIAWMLEDTAARFVVTNSTSEHKIPPLPHLEKIMLDEDNEQISSQPAIAIDNNPAAHQLAYVIFTSGSTGRPKGVMIEHRSLMNFLASMQNDVEFTTTSSLLSVTTCSFDIAYLEFYLPLITGATLILVSRQVAADGHELSRKLAFHQPTHMQATPSGWQILLNSGWKNSEQIKILTGGEALKEDIKNALVAIGTVWNLYGPTETTIWSTVKRLESHKKVSIGKPIKNTAIYIVGKGNSLAPVGVTGDLYIGGAGVARGYLNRPELTAEKFIINPFDGSRQSRVYQTGDCAKWQEQGDIEFAGRADEQVKIRGYRIELGEIESVLQESEWVNAAAVVARSGANNTPHLITYIVPNGEFDRDKILAWLRNRLPEYMVPAWFVPLEKMPYTNNGKINKKALPAVEISDQLNNVYTAPRTPLEQQLVTIWKQLLVIERIGIYDSFFDLGGNSILATRLVSAIKRELDLILPIRLFFELNNIHGIARYIELELAGSGNMETPDNFEIINI
jgi:amino acid adenylation domain-containing protein